MDVNIRSLRRARRGVHTKGGAPRRELTERPSKAGLPNLPMLRPSVPHNDRQDVRVTTIDKTYATGDHAFYPAETGE
jgi:hypothetical protein